MSDTQAVSNAVANLYNTYPFPPEPLLDEPPPGYNWRWNWLSAYQFCYGRKPPRQDVRILDAGCGTGVSTEYLVHLNPHASVTGLDLSSGALDVARERCQRSGADRVEFHHLSLYNVAQIPGEFDLINCVGVLHHLPDPIRGIQALAPKVAPGGLLHIFVYAHLGRFEIQLMQEAIALLQGDRRGDYKDGVHVGRTLFSLLPENNRILREEKRRWAMENHRDECFADMYVHPQEFDYTIDTLFELINASGLEFVGFSNPKYWSIDRLLAQSPELQARAEQLSDIQRYRLIELLDPELTHYEFFLARPPFVPMDWSSDEKLGMAIAEPNPCLHGWPAQSILDRDYQPLSLSDPEFQFMQECDGRQTINEILEQTGGERQMVRDLLDRDLILLTPADESEIIA